MSTIVHQQLRVPVKKSGRPHVFTVYCDAADRCELRDRGECMLVGSVFSAEKCPHGRGHWEEGPTPRARKHWEWKKAARAKADAQPSLNSPNKVFAFCGDHVYLPYSHMDFEQDSLNMPRVQWLRNLRKVIPLKDFTPDLVWQIATYRPQAAMGGAIQGYQEESVPRFLQHLAERKPEFWAQVVEAHPELATRLEATSPVGRKARLCTLTPHIGEFGDRTKWTWDGEHLHAITSVLGSPVGTWRDYAVRITPPSDTAVEITDPGQVNEGTEFLS